jgi:hypothetical protein
LSVDVDHADVAHVVLGEPQLVTGRRRSDPGNPAEIARNWIFRDRALRRDLPDVPSAELREPEIPVGAGSDVPGECLHGLDRKLGLILGVLRVQADDVVPDLLGEPDVAVRACRDVRRELADAGRKLVHEA